jgi:acetoin utilization protein AcuB
VIWVYKDVVMLIADIMTTNVETLRPADSLARIGAMFASKPFHHLLVIDGERLLGVISEGDCLKASSPFIGKESETDQDRQTLTLTAADIMTPNPVLVKPSMTTRQASMLVLERGIGCLPVVADGVLVGIVTWKDLLASFIRF